MNRALIATIVGLTLALAGISTELVLVTQARNRDKVALQAEVENAKQGGADALKEARVEADVAAASAAGAARLAGYQDGYTKGQSDGYSKGKTEGQMEALPQIQDAYNQGYADGYANVTTDGTPNGPVMLLPPLDCYDRGGTPIGDPIDNPPSIYNGWVWCQLP
jgi:hypothetical protein